MLERSVLALGIIALGVGGYLVARQIQLLVLKRNGLAAAPGLEDFRSGLPAILYFTTPRCVPCRTIQRPAVNDLKEEYSDSLQIIEIDAAARSEVAAHWGVLSVPTTFVLDGSGSPLHVNHGVARAHKLRKQLTAVRAR